MRFLFFYIFLIVLELLALMQRGHPNTIIPLEYCVRPLVLASLWVYFWKNSRNLAKPQQRKYFLVAIAIYWLGEMVFMFTRDVLMTSMTHVLAHIVSILAFNLDNPFKNIFKPKNFFFLSFVLGTVFIFFAYVLFELPPALRFPAIISFFVSSAWFLAAFNRIGFVSARSEQFVLLGVVLSMSCNFIYTMNLLISDLPPPDFTVAPLFAMAYYLIAEGILRNKNVKSEKRKVRDRTSY
jgi:YhhN family